MSTHHPKRLIFNGVGYYCANIVINFKTNVISFGYFRGGGKRLICNILSSVKMSYRSLYGAAN